MPGAGEERIMFYQMQIWHSIGEFEAIQCYLGWQSSTANWYLSFIFYNTQTHSVLVTMQCITPSTRYHETFYNRQNQQESTECFLMLISIILKGSMPDSSSTTYPTGAFYLTSCFHLFWKIILSAMYVDWGPPYLSLVVCYIFHLLMPLLCKTWC